MHFCGRLFLLTSLYFIFMSHQISVPSSLIGGFTHRSAIFLRHPSLTLVCPEFSIFTRFLCDFLLVLSAQRGLRAAYCRLSTKYNVFVKCCFISAWVCCWFALPCFCLKLRELCEFSTWIWRRKEEKKGWSLIAVVKNPSMCTGDEHFETQGLLLPLQNLTLAMVYFSEQEFGKYESWTGTFRSRLSFRKQRQFQPQNECCLSVTHK